MIIPAHNEEGVIGARLDNLLALDYPGEQLEIVVVSDGSTDGTDEIVARIRVARPACPPARASARRKLAALNHAVGESTRDVVAFSDANSSWAPDALRKLVRNLADESVAYVCGKLRLEARGRDEPRRRSTGATSCGCARASPRSARSPAATARSTPCGARTTSRTASARTSACRTRWSSAASARSTSPRRSRPRSPRAISRTSTGARCACSRGRGSTCSRDGCSPASARSTSSSSSRIACSATRAACCTSCCSRRASRSPATGSSTRSRSRCSSCGSCSPRSAACACAFRRRNRLLLLPRHVGDGRRARQLPALRRLAALGARGGRALRRAVALLAVAAAVCACASGSGSARDERDLSAYTGLATWVDLYDPYVLEASRELRRRDGGARRTHPLLRDVELPDEAGDRPPRPRRPLHRGRARARDCRSSRGTCRR